MKRIIGLIWGSLFAAGILMGGCSRMVRSVPSAAGQQQSATSASPAAAPADSGGVAISSDTPDAAAAGVLPVGFMDAVSAVLAQYPGAAPISCSLDYADGQLRWDLEVLAADGVLYEAAIDAQTSELLFAKTAGEPPEISAAEIGIGYEQAVQAAADLYPGGTVQELQVTRADGAVLYEVEMWDPQGTERRAYVSAQTGAAYGDAQTAAAAAGSPDDPYDAPVSTAGNAGSHTGSHGAQGEGAQHHGGVHHNG